MKLMNKLMRILRRDAVAQVKKPRGNAEQYYDNYNMLGTVLGGYCGMLKKR